MVTTSAWTHARGSFAGENWPLLLTEGYTGELDILYTIIQRVRSKGFFYKDREGCHSMLPKLFPKPKNVVIVFKVLPWCAGQGTFLRALWLLWCHHGEALCDPAGQFFHDRLSHLWEFLVEDVVGSLVDLNRSSETNGQRDGIHATKRLFIQSNNKYIERHKLQSMLSKLRQSHLPQRSQQSSMIKENEQMPSCGPLIFQTLAVEIQKTTGIWFTSNPFNK